MSLWSLRNRLSQLQTEEKTLKKRKSAVEDIIKKLGKKPIDNLDDSISAAKKTASYLSSGVSGSNPMRIISDDVSRRAQRGLGLDVWLDKDYLNREIARLETEISSVQRDIRRVKEQIREAERAALANLLP